MKGNKTINLTKKDWVEIYYALEYKLTSPALKGNSPGIIKHREHINRIIKKIGPDGQKAAAENQIIICCEGGIVTAVLADNGNAEYELDNIKRKIERLLEAHRQTGRMAFLKRANKLARLLM